MAQLGCACTSRAFYETVHDAGIDLDREDHGRWLAEVPALSSVMCCGETRNDAVVRIQALALRVVAVQLEHGEAELALFDLSFEAA